MLDAIDIARLFEKVLDNDMQQFNITNEAVKFGIECMAHVYALTTSLDSKRALIADYTDPAHRCAYLHKYAALHTAMVRDMLYEAVHLNYNLFHKVLFSGPAFKFCSLGGGPGTDVIGSLAALHQAFGYFDTSVTVVDYMKDWFHSFDSILNELGTGYYGAFGNNISHNLHWKYVGANLLKTLRPEVLDALSSASLITMIKFASAAKCVDTRNMIRNIFTAMMPGAVLFFIDNDGGGFHQLVVDAALEFGFISIFGPLRRENYSNELFRKRRFGYASCCQTTVTVHMWQKPLINHYYDNCRNDYNSNLSKNPLLASPPTPFLYLGQSPREPPIPSLLGPYTPLLGSYTPSLLGPIPSPNEASLLGPSPYTPSFPTLPSPDENCNRLAYASAYDVGDFTDDRKFLGDRDFRLPIIQDIPQSPRLSAIMPSRIVTPLSVHVVNSPHPVIYTPDSLPRGKRARVQGCFPLKIRQFRHHLSRKVNQVKARARSVFKKNKKTEKSHPIFRL